MKKAVACIIFLFALAILLTDPQTASEAVVSGLKNAASKVIPSIFPYMVLSDILLVYCTSQSGQKATFFKKIGVVLMGNLSGFPVGVKNCYALYESNEISSREALNLALLSGNASISFVISFVGSELFSNKKIGIILYVCQLLASLTVTALCSVISRKNTKKSAVLTNISAPRQREISLEESFVNAVTNSALSTLTVTAFITVFGVIINYAINLLNVFTDSEIASSIVASVLEISNGCVMSAAVNMPYGVIICAFAVGFTGISVMCQSFLFLKKSGISTKFFLFLKLIQGVISALIASVLIKFCDTKTEISAIGFKTNYPSNLASIIVLALITTVIIIKIKNLALKLLNKKERS